MEQPPTVVRIRRKGGEVVQDCDVYIGRRLTMGGWSLPESEWMNPFSAAKYGREECIEKFEELMRKRLQEAPERWHRKLQELSGKRLGCWCKPKACHGDVLVKLFNECLFTKDHPEKLLP